MDEFEWWGYKHKNGSIQIKRFSSEADIEDANESPFVVEVYGSVWAKSREEALEKMLRAANR